MKSLKGISALVLAGFLFTALQVKIGSAPPIGNFLDPFTGFWQNAENGNPGDRQHQLDGLDGPVTILYDSTGVPHIFAENDSDLFFAQGYATAADRLWQMEFQTMAAAGRVSEIVGSVAIDFDLYQRRMGMVFGAEHSLELMMAHPRSRMILEAYTRGVNAYIKNLRPRDYPFEYKLLGYAPEEWTPLKCALLLKQMTKTLNGGSDDYYLSNILAKYGEQVVKDLFPDRPFKASPVIPSGTAWNFQPLPLPEPDSGTTWKLIAPRKTGGRWRPERSVPGTGSSNWAISGSKTASGHPILSNDPHLNLTLPSLWYQVQLSSPAVNVCGVSLPGAPGVVIGFNSRIAWGVTNVGSDVLDFYRIRFKNGLKNEYWLDSAWVPVKKKVETVKVRGAGSVRDTVLYTRFGPVVYEEDASPFDASIPRGYAAKWIAHVGGNEVLTFYQLNRAANYDEYAAALRHYVAPAQNFVFAGAENDIAMWVNGKFPLKWKNQGKFLLDGSRSSNDWQGWIPHAHNPHVKNPSRGFVSSANQFSADTSYSYYLGWEYTQPDRAIRINQLLEGMQQATTDSIRLMQSDSYKKLAEWVLPAMLEALDTASLDAGARQARLALSAWDYRNSPAELAPSLFEIWWKFLEKAIWDDEFAKAGEQPMRYPGHDRTIHLLNLEKNAPWFDNVNTAPEEGLHDVITGSYQRTIDSLRQTYGPIGKAWQWGNVKGTHIAHILGQDALGTETLFIGGGKGTINALNDHNGPSWRMVVEMGDTIKAFGVYPGGQSGNPGSPLYDNMIETWRQGKLNKLIFLSEADEMDPGIVSKTVLK